MGKQLAKTDKWDEASNAIEPLFLRAEELQQLGKPNEALALYEAWLQANITPNRFLVLFNQACLLQKLNRADLAEKAYRACVEQQPDFAQALINWGLLLEAAGDSAGALERWARVMASHYGGKKVPLEMAVMALNHIGRLQENLRQYDAAERALKESLQLNPEQPGVIQHWIHIRQKACQWPIYEPFGRVTRYQQLMCTSPLAELAMHDDPAHQLLIAKAFVERTYTFKPEPISAHAFTRHDRLRIGYVSGDLCVHAVGLLMADVLEQHDRSAVEVFVYDFSPEDGTAHRSRIKQAVEHWRDIRALSDRQVAEAIVSDQIDVLIDMHGLSSGARPGVFAFKPAPVQGQYLGFIGPTAMPWLDFVVTDSFALTEQAAAYYAETPLRVDGSFIPMTGCESSQDEATQAAQCQALRQEMGWDPSTYVMAAFGNLYKINEALFTHWLQILKAVPESVLWLVDDNAQATTHLQKFAQRMGVAASQLKFTPRVSPTQFRLQLKCADVFLDTYPYNCGSTTNDVLAAGTPMVTLSGQTPVSRMGGSMLTALGMSNWIAYSYDEYRALVIELAQRKRQGLRDRYDKTAEIKAVRKRMVRSLERGLQDMLAQKRKTSP